MTPLDEKVEVLKNAHIVRVQKDIEWPKSIEDAISKDVMSIIDSWEVAARTEHIGPVSIYPYLEKIRTFMKEIHILPQPEDIPNDE